ncbi:MAG TPA: CHRD domain-containing protein [Steroidobacteraceae bacterium]|jgi:hypothetical protein
MRTAYAMFVMAAVLALAPISRARADTLLFQARLQGSKEKIPNSVRASGQATVELDTAAKTVRYRVIFSGLSGPGTLAHYHGAMLPDIMFHGPKLPGARAPELIFMIDHPVSPVTGIEHVNDRQIVELKAGEWYVNIHTPKYPAGEIRGWLEPAGAHTGGYSAGKTRGGSK